MRYAAAIRRPAPSMIRAGWLSGAATIPLVARLVSLWPLQIVARSDHEPAAQGAARQRILQRCSMHCRATGCQTWRLSCSPALARLSTPRAEKRLAALPGAIDLVGRLSLPGVAACHARCARFAGNHSGVVHLAASADTPTLGLFGPTPRGSTRRRAHGRQSSVTQWSNG